MSTSHSASKSSEYNSRSTSRSIARFDSFYNEDETSSEAGSSVLMGVLWKRLKVCLGQGKVAQLEQSTSLEQEIDLGTSIISVAWASGALGMNW